MATKIWWNNHLKIIFESMGGGKYRQKALAPPGAGTIELRDFTMPFIFHSVTIYYTSPVNFGIQYLDLCI